MKKSRISRRKFIVGTGTTGLAAYLTFDPVSHLIRAMLNGRIAHAAQLELSNSLKVQSARNYLQINLYGAPSRWFFDHILRPTDDDIFVPAVGVYNRFANIDYEMPHLSKGEYSVTKLNKINMPCLWGFDVPNSKGGKRKLSELMDNMLAIRGCNPMRDGHPINSARQVSPIPGETSITGIVADHSSALFPAINIGQTPANFAFKSNRSLNAVNIPSDHPDYISYLMDAFYRKDGSDYVGKSSDDKIEEAMGILHKYSLTNNPGAEVLYSERKSAEKLFRVGIENLAGIFPILEKKYEDLLARSVANSNLENIDDKPIPGIKLPTAKLNATHHGFASHHFFGKYIASDDVREMFKTAQIPYLAKHFALAEFALVNGLSSSILLAPPLGQEQSTCSLHNIGEFDYFQNTEIQAIKDELTQTHKVNANNRKLFQRGTRIPHDGHETGWIVNVLTCTKFYRGLGACLLELKDRLKEKSVGSSDLFSETVIHIASEFERCPSQDGGGSIHNISSHVTSIFSGAIKKPMVLGNIYAGTEPRTIKPIGLIGTIGDAAPVKELDNQTININNISSTLSELLRVPRIIKRAKSLIAADGDKITPAIENGRNIIGRA